jgi:hypothetical protein
VHVIFWWPEICRDHLLFNPQHDVVPGAAVVIAKIVIKTHLANISGSQELDDLLRPVRANPTVWGRNHHKIP